MSTPRRVALFSLITGLVVGLDQLSKLAACRYLAPRPPISLLGGIVQFVYSENVGAFLGLGAGLPPGIRTLIFGVLAGLLLIVVAAYTLTARGLTPAEVAAASLVVAGGTGNLIDRVLRDGRVIDFVSVGVGPLRTGIFNVADVAVMLGVGWFLILLTTAGGTSPQIGAGAESGAETDAETNSETNTETNSGTITRADT